MTTLIDFRKTVETGVDPRLILAVLRTGYGKSLVITAVPVTTWYMQCVKEGH